MGIASWALGDDNPFAKYVADNKNLVHGAFAGLGQGKTFGQGLGNAALYAQQGGMVDDIARKERTAETEAAALKEKYASWFTQQGQPQIAQGIADGIIEPGKAYWDFITPKETETVKPIEVNGQLVDPMTGRVIGDYRDPNSGMGDAPSGYQWNQDGTQGFIPGGPADPANMGKTTEAQRRNQQLASVIQPELATVEQNWNELASGGNQAANAVPFGAGFGMTSPGYQQATNSLATIAQSYLYSVSGAAAPAEEVAKLVDSVTPKPFESPQSIEAKRARIRQMADAVIQAGGAGGAQQPQSAPAGQTSSGLQWSLEP